MRLIEDVRTFTMCTSTTRIAVSPGEFAGSFYFGGTWLRRPELVRAVTQRLLSLPEWMPEWVAVNQAFHMEDVRCSDPDRELEAVHRFVDWLRLQRASSPIPYQTTHFPTDLDLHPGVPSLEELLLESDSPPDDAAVDNAVEELLDLSLEHNASKRSVEQTAQQFRDLSLELQDVPEKILLAKETFTRPSQRTLRMEPGRKRRRSSSSSPSDDEVLDGNVSKRARLGLEPEQGTTGRMVRFADLDDPTPSPEGRQR